MTHFIPDTLICLVPIRRNHKTHKHAVITLTKIAKTQQMQKKKPNTKQNTVIQTQQPEYQHCLNLPIFFI